MFYDMYVLRSYNYFSCMTTCKDRTICDNDSSMNPLHLAYLLARWCILPAKLVPLVNTRLVECVEVAPSVRLDGRLEEEALVSLVSTFTC